MVASIATCGMLIRCGSSNTETPAATKTTEAPKEETKTTEAVKSEVFKYQLQL